MQENKKFFHYLKKIKRTGKILIVFGIPLILAIPFPPPPFHTDQFKAEQKNGEPTQQEKFSFLTKNEALGASILSKILNIKTSSMPGYICIDNTSEIFAEGKKLDKSELLEDKEGGAISIPLFLDDIVTQVYIPFASTTCVYPKTVSGFAELDNKIEIRGFMSMARPKFMMSNETLVISIKQYSDLVTIFNMQGKKGYKWDWSIFLENYILFLIGWIILLSSVFQVYVWWSKNK